MGGASDNGEETSAKAMTRANLALNLAVPTDLACCISNLAASPRGLPVGSFPKSKRKNSLSTSISSRSNPDANAVPVERSVAPMGLTLNGGGGTAPVVLNVYNLPLMNNYLYWFGLGIFRSRIKVHGMEYGFGAHEFPTSGVFEGETKSCAGFVYRRSVWMGTTEMSRAEIRSFIENLAEKYNGNTYHLISMNCNHFIDGICKNLTGKSIPGLVNRLARVGSFFNCLLPKSIQVYC